MTKKDAYKEGLSVADEIVCYGEFTPQEMASEEKYLEACYEIAENRKQYAGDITYDFKRDSEWEGYEDGITAGLQKAARRLFKETK